MAELAAVTVFEPPIVTQSSTLAVVPKPAVFAEASTLNAVEPMSRSSPEFAGERIIPARVQCPNMPDDGPVGFWVASYLFVVLFHCKMSPVVVPRSIWMSIRGKMFILVPLFSSQ
jgi:hypothetical protein